MKINIPRLFSPIIGVPVPIILEKALGYHYGRRFVGFWWDNENNELSFYDGNALSHEGSSRSWLKYVGHEKVKHAFSSFRFGTINSKATHWLILDRETRRLYASLIKDAEIFLDAQQYEVMPDFDKTLTDTIDHLDIKHNWYDLLTIELDASPFDMHNSR